MSIRYLDKEKNTKKLPEWLSEKSNLNLISFVYKVYLNNRRKNLANVKGRSDVIGSNKKPWRQKGTGNARHGTKKSPIWIGGGITFGPNSNRNYSKKILKSQKNKAFKDILATAVANNNLVIFTKLPKFSKTKEVVTWLSTNKIDLPATLVINDKVNGKNVFRNIKNLSVTNFNSPDFIALANSKTILCEQDGINKENTTKEEDR